MAAQPAKKVPGCCLTIHHHMLPLSATHGASTPHGAAARQHRERLCHDCFNNPCPEAPDH
jgi:hypothetical protein